jgi:hypothetical protein
MEANKIVLPFLHIKLGVMKNFVKAMDRDGSAFKYLAQKFLRLSEAKIKEGIFSVLKSEIYLETRFSIAFYRVTRKMLGKRFIRYRATSSAMLEQKTTRNWWRTYC